MSFKALYKRVLPEVTDLVFLQEGKTSGHRLRSAWLGVAHAVMGFPAILLPGLWRSLLASLVLIFHLFLQLLVVWLPPFVAAFIWLWHMARSGIIGQIVDADGTEGRTALDRLASKSDVG